MAQNETTISHPSLAGRLLDRLRFGEADGTEPARSAGPELAPATRGLAIQTEGFRRNAGLAAHPLFVPLVAAWFAALFGLGVAVLPAALLARLVDLAGISAVIPAAAPPLGMTARIAIALACAVPGALLGLALAARVRALQTAPATPMQPPRKAADRHPDAPAKRPINAIEELGSEGLGPVERVRKRGFGAPAASAADATESPSSFLRGPLAFDPAAPLPDAGATLELASSGLWQELKDEAKALAKAPPAALALASGTHDGPRDEPVEDAPAEDAPAKDALAGDAPAAPSRVAPVRLRAVRSAPPAMPANTPAIEGPVEELGLPAMLERFAAALTAAGERPVESRQIRDRLHETLDAAPATGGQPGWDRADDFPREPFQTERALRLALDRLGRLSGAA